MLTLLGWTIIGALCGHPVTGLVVGLVLVVLAAVIETAQR